MPFKKFMMTLLALLIIQIHKVKANSNKTTATILRVAPYPYLPDSVGDNFKSLLEFMKTDFEKAYPDITVELRPMDNNDDFYDLSTLSQWLASNGSGYDVVEVDTVLLGDLIVAGLVAPQFVIPDNHSDWIPPAASAVQFNQALIVRSSYIETCSLKF